MASNYESSDLPDPEFGTGDSRSEQLFADFEAYLAGITEVGGAEAYFTEAVEREQGVSAGDQGRDLKGEAGDEPFGTDEAEIHDEAVLAAAGDPDAALDKLDPFSFWEADALAAAPDGVPEHPLDGTVPAEHAVVPVDPMEILREQSQAHVREAASPAGEAERVNQVSQQTEAKAIALLDVPNRRGASYALALTDVSRFAYEQDDLDSVRAVQGELQKQPDNGSQSIEYAETNRALATAYYHGLSLGDVESASRLGQLLEQEQQVAADKGRSLGWSGDSRCGSY